MDVILVFVFLQAQPSFTIYHKKFRTFRVEYKLLARLFWFGRTKKFKKFKIN